MTEPFVSELGATCLPNYQTLIKFMPNGWPIRDHADEWFFRRLQIPEALRAWGDPGELTLREYIPAPRLTSRACFRSLWSAAAA